MRHIPNSIGSLGVDAIVLPSTIVAQSKIRKKQVKQEKKNTQKVIFKRLNLLYIWFYNIILIELYH